MSTAQEAVPATSRHHAAVHRFLQSALIVDDDATMGSNTTTESVHVLHPPGPPAGSLPPKEGQESQGAEDGEEPAQSIDGVEIEVELHARVDVKRLADAFASLGIACAVLRPEKGDEVAERVLAVGTRVDILIMDWRINDRTGDTALDAITRLLARSGVGRHRLIAIYTSQQNLDAIADALRKIDGVEDGPAEHCLTHAGTAIRIFRKHPDGLVSGLGVAESDLPELLVEAFADASKGLLPTATLNAVAATRENTYRLLARLSNEVDIGYAGQLLRVEHIEDAAQQLVEVIAEEFRAIIEDDAATGAAASKEGLSEWLRDRESNDLLSCDAATLEAMMPIPVADNSKPWKQFKNDHQALKDVKESGLSALCAPPSDGAASRLSDDRFAMLMSLRHSYRGPGRAPALHLGSVVRDMAGTGRYWLCVQPMCDSVRLTQPTPFPFLRLELADQEPPTEKFSLVVESEASRTLHLWLESKPSDLHMVWIAPGETGSALFEEANDGRLTMAYTGGQLEWIAELRTEQAQRAVSQLAHTFARVGLNESEWLRLRTETGTRPADTRVPPVPAESG